MNILTILYNTSILDLVGESCVNGELAQGSPDLAGTMTRAGGRSSGLGGRGEASHGLSKVVQQDLRCEWTMGLMVRLFPSFGLSPLDRDAIDVALAGVEG